MPRPLNATESDDFASNRHVSPDTIIYFAGKLAEAAAEKRLAAKAYSTLRKEFKETGLTLGVFDTVVRLVEQDDPDAVGSFVDEFLHIAQAFSMIPPGTQLNFFDGAGSAVDERERARKDGEIRGLMGKNPDEQRYQPGSDLHQEHMAGWHDGQGRLQQQFIAHNERLRREKEEREAKKAKATKENPE